MDKEAKEKLGEKMIQKSPIKFIQDFMLTEHAFLNRPNRPTGMAEIRTAMQFVYRKRKEILGIGETTDSPAELLQVAPIYFDREFCRRHKKIDEYNRQTNEKLQQCSSKFKHKKSDASNDYQGAQGNHKGVNVSALSVLSELREQV